MDLGMPKETSLNRTGPAGLDMVKAQGSSKLPISVILAQGGGLLLTLKSCGLRRIS